MTTLSGSAFGETLRQLREGLGLSKYQVSKMSGVDQALVSRLETGERKPTDEVLAKLAPALDVPFEDLKRAALRDRLSADEREAAAEVFAEEATQDQMAEVLGVYSRAHGISSAEEMQKLIEAALKFKNQGMK